MNTLLTIRISKRKTIQLTIDEARQLYNQLHDWLSPKPEPEVTPIQRTSFAVPINTPIFDEPCKAALDRLQD